MKLVTYPFLIFILVSAESKMIMEKEKLVEKFYSTLKSYIQSMRPNIDMKAINDYIKMNTNYIKDSFNVCATLPISTEEKQNLLEINEVATRLKTTIELMELIIKVKFSQYTSNCRKRARNYKARRPT